MASIKSKAQSWAVDITIATVVFVGAFFLFYALLYTNTNTQAEDLQKDAALIIRQVATSLKIIHNNEVNVSRLNEIKNLSYDELKTVLRTEGDFCIYFEDEKGNIILINNSYRAVGAPIINLSGIPCNSR